MERQNSIKKLFLIAFVGSLSIYSVCKRLCDVYQISRYFTLLQTISRKKISSFVELRKVSCTEVETIQSSYGNECFESFLKGRCGNGS